MASDTLTLEYDLADAQHFASPRVRTSSGPALYLLRYGQLLVCCRGAKRPEGALMLAEAQQTIAASGHPARHAQRVYVASKHLAGSGGGLAHAARVFSSHEAMEAYLFHQHPDDPSPREEDLVASMATCILDATGEHMPCSCLAHLAQEDALEALHPAVPAPAQGGRIDARAATLTPGATTLGIELEDGRRLQVPRSWFAFLDPEDAAQWQGASLDGTRQFILWPRTAKRVAVEGLLGVA